MNYASGNTTPPLVTILLVDDNIHMLQQVRNLVSAEPGVEVIGEAMDGLEAVAKARELKPHLVLMDVRLPGQNGLEATLQLKAEMPEIQIIVLTLYDLPIYHDTALANGASAYVIKKAMRSELLPAIRRVMQASNAAGITHPEHVRPGEPANPKGVSDSQHTQPLVLIVEDNMLNQRVAQVCLGQLGCQVDLATNGLEALVLLNRRPYDLVLMDCEMPEMDGFEATAEIRRHHVWPHIPIIAMTAGAQQDDRLRCLAAGMDDYLGKPVQMETLTRILTRWIPAISSESLDKTNEASLQRERPSETENDKSPAALDPVTLQRLRKLAQVSEAAWFTRLLKKFQSDAAADISAVRRAVAEDDNISLNLTVHRLRGASLNIGALEMGDICRRLETLDSSQVREAVVLMAQLEREFKRVQAEIGQALNY